MEPFTTRGGTYTRVSDLVSLAHLAAECGGAWVSKAGFDPIAAGGPSFDDELPGCT